MHVVSSVKFTRFVRAVPAGGWPANRWRIRCLSRWRVLPSSCPVAARPGGRMQMTRVGRATAEQLLVIRTSIQCGAAGSQRHAREIAIEELKRTVVHVRACAVGHQSSKLQQ